MPHRPQSRCPRPFPLDTSDLLTLRKLRDHHRYVADKHTRLGAIARYVARFQAAYFTAIITNIERRELW
jgi:hypothetical protein